MRSNEICMRSLIRSCNLCATSLSANCARGVRYSKTCRIGFAEGAGIDFVCSRMRTCPGAQGRARGTSGSDSQSVTYIRVRSLCSPPAPRSAKRRRRLLKRYREKQESRKSAKFNAPDQIFDPQRKVALAGDRDVICESIIDRGNVWVS